MDKYQESFKLLEKANEFKTNVDELHEHLDALMEFMSNNFEKLPRDVDLYKKFKFLNVPDAMYGKELKENPEFFGEHLFPIFLVRYGIHENGMNLPIKPTRLKHFNWFHKTFVSLFDSTYLV